MSDPPTPEISVTRSPPGSGPDQLMVKVDMPGRWTRIMVLDARTGYTVQSAVIPEGRNR